MNKDIRQIKNGLREQCKQIRAEMSEKKRESCDKAIFDFLTSTEEYSRCHQLLTYVSTPIEVGTYALIQRALEDGKQVACPRCIPNTRLMEFIRIESIDELSPGQFGVFEPERIPGRIVADFSDSICIVPGLAFDSLGFRLGYGKGYYDRFLSAYTGGCIGICYSECMRPRLPHGRFDRSVDFVITESGIILCKAAESSAADAPDDSHI